MTTYTKPLDSQSIYQQSLADAQVENVAKKNIPTIHTIPVEGVNVGTFSENVDNFHHHYQAFYAGQGYGFKFFEPAYRYGLETVLANHYYGQDWGKQRNHMQREWERINPNTWEIMKDAVKHGWNRALDIRDLLKAQCSNQ